MFTTENNECLKMRKMIENNLELVGDTAIKDMLQEK
jgi:hypothetical protein